MQERRCPPVTFVNFAHNGGLQPSCVVLARVEPKEDTTLLGGQAEGGQEVDVSSSEQGCPDLLRHSGHLPRLAHSQQVNHWPGEDYQGQRAGSNAQPALSPEPWGGAVRGDPSSFPPPLPPGGSVSHLPEIQPWSLSEDRRCASFPSTLLRATLWEPEGPEAPLETEPAPGPLERPPAGGAREPLC